MQLRYLVVDQNFLRADELRSQLVSDPSLCIVLPDLAFLEITKNERWELTLRLSLAVLAAYRQRVFVGRSVSESLRYELGHGKPVTGHMTHREATRYVREILASVESGTEGEGIARIRSNPDNHLQELQRDYLDHGANKLHASKLVDATKLLAPSAFAKRVRGSRASREERLEFLAKQAPSILVGVLMDNGFSRERAISFARKKPMLLRYFYLKMWASIDWLEMGRLEGLGEKKVTNDLLDHEYVLTATFFDGVLSKERKVNDAYHDLMHLLSGRV